MSEFADFVQFKKITIFDKTKPKIGDILNTEKFNALCSAALKISSPRN